MEMEMEIRPKNKDQGEHQLPFDRISFLRQARRRDQALAHNSPTFSQNSNSPGSERVWHLHPVRSWEQAIPIYYHHKEGRLYLVAVSLRSIACRLQKPVP